MEIESKSKALFVAKSIKNKFATTFCGPDFIRWKLRILSRKWFQIINKITLSFLKLISQSNTRNEFGIVYRWWTVKLSKLILQLHSWLVRLGRINDHLNLGITLKRRIIEDLRPSALTDLGLTVALQNQRLCCSLFHCAQ